MSVYLREIESTVCKIIHAHKYARRLESLTEAEEDDEVIKKMMRSFEPPVALPEDYDAYKNLHVPQAFIPNPSKDNYPSEITSSMIANKPHLELMINGILAREDLVVMAKKNIRFKSSVAFNKSAAPSSKH